MNTTLSKSVKPKVDFPSLSENTTLRYIHFIALYLAQGIPEGMILFGIPAWMAMNGKSAGEIGSFVAIFGLPWSFKMLVAPLMDRFTFLSMGRRRPWVIFGQLGLILSFMAMAFVPDPINNMPMMMIAAFAIGLFGSIQDVATDGMAVDIIPVNQQAKANGLMWGSKIIGTSASLALGSYILNQYNFSIAILMLSCAVALIMLFPLFIRERKGEKLLPWNHGEASAETRAMQLENWSVIFKSLFKVLTLRNSLILTALTFLSQISFNYIATLLPIFTVQSLGWTDQAYSNFFAIASLIGGIGGMLIGGILIDRFGKRRMMNFYYGLFIFLVVGFVLMHANWNKTWFVNTFMVMYQILYVFTTIGIFAMAMECCWKKVSASQFTVYMTIGNIGRIIGAKLIGPVSDQFNWEYTILVFTLIIGCAWIILQFLNITSQVKQIVQLDAADPEDNM